MLETITVQYRQDTDAALMEVIRKWFHTHHNPSWEEVQQIFSNLIVSGKSLLLGPFSMVIIYHTHSFLPLLMYRAYTSTILLFSDASLTKQRYFMTEDDFKKCLPNVMHYTSVSTLLPYLLKYRLVHMADVDSVQSPYLDNSTRMTNLLNLTKRNGGKNGFGLLYDCLIAAGPSDFPHMLQWTRCDIPALQRMSSPIDTVHGDTAYFRPYRSRKIYSYNLTTGWSICADCLVRNTSLVVLPVAYKGADQFLLHTIGGIKRKINRKNKGEEEFTDHIYQLTNREWTCSSIYPKLRTQRSQVTVVFSDGCLIIAGGNSAHGPVNTVDVLIVTYQDKVWREVASLPYKVFRPSGCVCNGVLYILGGYVSPFGPIRSVCVATVSQLVESNSNDQNIFNTIKDLELYDSACVSFRNHILAIGGWKKLGSALTDQPKGTKLVHVYDMSRNIWKELKGQLSEPRCFAFAAAFEDKIMLVGGYDRPNGTCTDSVEFAIIPSDEPEQVCQAPLQSEREAVVQALVSSIVEACMSVVCVCVCACVGCVHVCMGVGVGQRSCYSGALSDCRIVHVLGYTSVCISYSNAVV